MGNNKVTDIHHGRNVKRLREAKGIKQETMAKELFDCAQSKVVYLESKSIIDDSTLIQIANYFNLDVDVLKNLQEDPARVVIENTFENGSTPSLCGNNIENQINHPLEAIIQLNKEKEELYERLLSNERERNEQLMKCFEELIQEKNKIKQ